MGTRPFIIGVLYESDEWSDHKLAAELEKQLARMVEKGAIEGPVQVELIFMESPCCIEEALECDLLISRVFASAQFRGHNHSLAAMNELCDVLIHTGIPIINPPHAHRFETDKEAATKTLAAAGLATPAMYGRGIPNAFGDAKPYYPAIIKPNCGGRTTHTAILQTSEDLAQFLAISPSIEFLLEEYLEPTYGFITRVEIIGGKVGLVVKRSIASGGLSAYHLGSTYELYDDCPTDLHRDALAAAKILGFFFGSFDIIETERGNFFIDANSVSNVSEDCTETFNLDLMAEYAKEIVKHLQIEGGKLSACGSCAQACTHKSIVAGVPYSILGERCDECGNCHNVCPVGAVVEKGPVW